MDREYTENYLLTLASRIKDVKSVVVVVAEKDGRYTNHQADFDEGASWVNTVGNLQAVAHDILNNKVAWHAVAVDGSELPDEENQEDDD